MNSRIEQFIEACSSAMMTGVKIDAVIYGVSPKSGVWTSYRDTVCPLGALLLGRDVTGYADSKRKTVTAEVESILGVGEGYASSFSATFLLRDCKESGKPTVLGSWQPYFHSLGELDSLALYTYLERQGMIRTNFNFLENFSKTP